jgi:hypothetical protein
MNKRLLILRAAEDVCGNEVSLIKSHCELLEFSVCQVDIGSTDDLKDQLKKLHDEELQFDYVYLCTHGNTECFLADTQGKQEEITWIDFSLALCENDTVAKDGILLLACCKGGFYQVAADVFAVCTAIDFVCGVKWSVSPWDLTTGFVVFIHNMETKRTEPSYAAQKASLATDFSFVCYDRDDAEMNPSYQNRRFQVFLDLGWIDQNGYWIEENPIITENADNEQFRKSTSEEAAVTEHAD